MGNQEAQYRRMNPAAQAYAQLGWKILPTHGIAEDGRCTCGQMHKDQKDIGKHPASAHGQTDATTDAMQIDLWWQTDPRWNVAVMARDSGFLVFDIDPRSGGYDSLDRFEELTEGRALPKTVKARTGSYSYMGKLYRGTHLFYKCDPSAVLVPNLNGIGLKGIDIKHNGYALLAPSNHLSGVSYEWVEGQDPWSMEMAEAPEELMSILRRGTRKSAGSSPTGKHAGHPWGWIDDLDWDHQKFDIEKILAEGVDEGARVVTLYALTCAIANKYDMNNPMDRQNVETMVMRFNHEKVNPPLEHGELMTQVSRAIEFVRENPKAGMTDAKSGIDVTGFVTARTPAPTARIATGNNTVPMNLSEPAYDKMLAAPPAPPSRQRAALNVSDPDEIDYLFVGPSHVGSQISEMASSGRSIYQTDIHVPKDTDALTAEDGGDTASRSLTDIGNGRRFVDSFGAIVRYTPGLGWFYWDTRFWEPDTESIKTRELSKKLPTVIASEAAFHADDPSKQQDIVKWANKAKTMGTLTTAVKIAETDPRIVIQVDDWDSDPELLGADNGVINLRTGELFSGDPNTYITRRSPVAYTPGIQNPRWLKFLDFATNGDKEFQSWLQRAVGYTLTGLNTLDVMFLVHGPGGTGKNVFVEAIVKLLGSNEYAWPLDSQILAQGNGMANQADLYHWAQLRGRRMVWVDELPDGERLKENSVKKLTGSTEISARSPGESPFTFKAQAKLWVSTNHRPIITDDAMWRRIRPIPWERQPLVPDPSLKEYIFDPQGGLPGVLAWAVEGAMQVLNSKEDDPLGWCKVVRHASEAYRAHEDRIGQFLEDETVVTPGQDATMNEVFSVYQQWTFDRGEKPLSMVAFERKLLDRSIKIDGSGKNSMVRNRIMARKVAQTIDDPLNWGSVSNFNF